MFNWLKTAILMAGITALFMMAGAALGGRHGMLLALAFAVAANFFACWFSDRTVRRRCSAREVDELSASEFHRMVADPTAGLAVAFPAPIAGMPIRMATARRMIVTPLSGGGLRGRGLFSTHPSTDERIGRLMRMAAAGVR